MGLPLIDMSLKAESTAELQALLTFLQKWNEVRIAKLEEQGGAFPHPYAPELRLRYLPDPIGKEIWPTAEQILQRGGANCDGLSAYLAAWLNRHGGRARAVVRESPGIGWHCVVHTPAGELDPSRVLGMK